MSKNKDKDKVEIVEEEKMESTGPKPGISIRASEDEKDIFRSEA